METKTDKTTASNTKQPEAAKSAATKVRPAATATKKTVTKNADAKPATSAKPAAAKAKPAAAKAKPTAAKAKPATPAKTATKAKPAKKAENAVAEVKEETTEGEKVHVLEKMIDFSYLATTSIPLGGKYVKKVFDKYETKKHAKNFSHRFFEPFFPFPKVKK